MIATTRRLCAFRTVWPIVLTSLSFLLALGTPAQSATFTWDAGGGDRNWSTPENWEGGGAPASASDTTVVFRGDHSGDARLPIQDIADPFQLNRLEILTGAGTFSISGLPLEFVADGTTQPALYSTRASTSTLSNDIVIPAGTTLHVDLATYHLNLTGVVSGEGGIDKSHNAGGIDLRNSANSFSGGLTIRASDGNWRKVNVTASGAMGTGPVNLHGGTLGTSHTSPGG